MNTTVGKRIKELRKAHGWTQVQLSEKLNKGDSTVRMWELGKSEPDNETIVLLSKLFGVSTDYLLGVEPHDGLQTAGEPMRPLRRLAESLGITGSAVRSIERGDRDFSMESLKRACDYMGVTADYLLEQPPEAMLSRFITSCMELLNSGEAQRLSPITAKKLTVIGLMGELDALDGQTQTDILNKILQTLGDE